MGDTGSLILGYIMSILAIKFNEFNINIDSIYHIHAAPAVSIGIILLPLFDTIRVFVTRIFNGKSPFSPDKTHIHHYLLELGLTHFQATAILFGVSCGFVAISFGLRNLTVAWLLLVLFVLASLVSYTAIGLVSLRKKSSGGEPKTSAETL